MSASQKRIGLILAGLFIVLGLGYNYYTPLWAPPDEERHLAYCEYIAQNKKLPHLDASEEGFHIAQALHPPLYYLIGSLFCSKDTELILQKVSINEGPGYTIIAPPANEDATYYASEAKSAYLLRLLSLLFGGIDGIPNLYDYPKLFTRRTYGSSNWCSISCHQSTVSPYFCFCFK